ncbi:MAG: hypothetical protein GW839_11965 [Flavobacteriales bacterium]|nr:hypothetical protein [Flavobacteriia bacterium]NCP07001.1 hypothetical protein [Flavobacteriales bacterium]PIV95055.1 MAG: hypothetical protein COW44_00760 [Flavobacteriaceae bacterium CG17_big_fil_post_rev_8_21_14_2_50_33_15]PIY09279.1 MAG: hypothetical protein COZ17_13430 [Flavobacteriaceae bacterium CG_4_10_14_3_um_filter_33_47]PJB20253.1 MAG: hypothetical protein CO117_01490 [Flavobacteriaceae bacterium CG_4_9_14_3_um_filter_33_16]
MRRKVLFVLMSLVVLISCNKEEESTNNLVNIEKSGVLAKEFLGSKVGYEKNGEFVLTVNAKELVHSFNNFSSNFKLGYRAVSHHIEEIDGNNYLRFFNEDGSISTIALLKEKNNNSNSKKSTEASLVYAGNTVCTTEACANCCGCVPDGDYCSACQLDGTDCVRTTSG